MDLRYAVGANGNRLLSSVAGVKNEWSYTPSPSAFMYSVDRANFTFLKNILIHLAVCITTGPKLLKSELST
jgi:hypothetical protein